MKTIFCLSGMILLINYSYAQKASFGVTAGATLSSYKVTIESVSLTSDSRVGFTAGVVASCPIGQSFSFRPGLNYTQKGGKLSDDYGKDEITLNYLEVPLDFVYNTHSTKGKFFAGAGPSISLGLSGKEKFDGGSEDIKFGGGDDADFTAFEAGVNILAGYQFSNGIFFAANYNAGLSNIAPDDPEFDSKYHNRYFGLRLGFMFGAKSKPASSTN